MTDTAYAIVSGEYSDYTVHSVFTTRELAEKQLFAYSGLGFVAEIEELPLNPEFPEPPQGMSTYSCSRFKKTGTIWALRRMPSDVTDFHSVCEYPAAVCVYVYARDENHAIKIAAERFARYDAEEAGIA